MKRFGTGGPERRESIRHRIEVPVEISSGRTMAIHVTRDLSVDGAFVGQAIPYAVGTLVRLRLELPGEPEPVCCDGEIVNVPDARNFGMGVRFVGMAAADRDRLDSYARRHAQDVDGEEPTR